MARSAKIRLGTIIWAEVREPDGTPAGEHPAVVLSPQPEIDAGMDLIVAVCSRNFHYPLPSGWFEVPSKPGGHETTGLDQACVVKATWLEVAPLADVRKTAGRAPASVFKQVLNWLEDKRRESSGQ